MKKKKNSFFTFIFSMIPGAAQMYMGFMRRGLSLMSLFFFIIFLGVWSGLGPIMLLIPIIWFYSFFDVYNIRSLTDQEIEVLKDDFILIEDMNEQTLTLIKSKYRNVLAIAFIIIGTSILWNNVSSILGRILPGYLSDLMYQLGRYLPQFVIGTAIILLGLYLIRGKKIELDQLDTKEGDLS